jgi:hypothetical protein
LEKKLKKIKERVVRKWFSSRNPAISCGYGRFAAGRFMLLSEPCRNLFWPAGCPRPCPRFLPMDRKSFSKSAIIAWAEPTSAFRINVVEFFESSAVKSGITTFAPA